MPTSRIPFKSPSTIILLISLGASAHVVQAQRPEPRLLPPIVARSTSAKPAYLPAGAEPPEYPTIPATSLPTKPVIEAAAVPDTPPVKTAPAERTADVRFAQLRVRKLDGIAFISGTVRDAVDVWDLAEQLRVDVSVQRVVVGDIQVLHMSPRSRR